MNAMSVLLIDQQERKIRKFPAEGKGKGGGETESQVRGEKERQDHRPSAGDDGIMAPTTLMPLPGVPEWR